MTNVVPLRPTASEEVVALLRDALEAAERGEIVGVLLVKESQSEWDYIAHSGDLIGMTGYLAHTVVPSLADDED